MDVRGLVQYMIDNAVFSAVAGNPLAQLGPTGQNFLGATLLPEINVPENRYLEENISYRTVIANDAGRYSPVQLKGSVLVGSMEVSLSDSDIGSQFTGRQYDALLNALARFSGQSGNVNRPSPEAILSLTKWSDITLNRPLIVKNEKMRWDAIVNAQVVRTGDGGYREVITYPNPTGHRVAAGGVWSNNSYDAWADIIAGAEFLAAKGYTVNRMIGGTSVLSKLTNNDKIKQRGGLISIASGTVVGMAGRVSQADLNDMLANDNLPPFERYDRQYKTQTSSGYYLSRSALVLVATTGRNDEIDRGDLEPAVKLRDTLGYVGVGRAAGQQNPGRVIEVEGIFNKKPPRIEGEAWQTSLPVITEPEAIYVITGIS